MSSQFNISLQTLSTYKPDTRSQMQYIKTHSPIHDCHTGINHMDDNRYHDVLPFDYTLVKSKEYINANWVNGYLVTQAPLEHTTSTFWYMLWQHYIQTIVMLTPLMDQDKEKCHLYWPTLNDQKHGDLTIRLLKEININNSLVLRKFVIIKDVDNHKIKRIIFQYHFKSWPDYGCPNHMADFIQLVKYVPHQAVCVHCSAGIGRSGVFITIHQHLLFIITLNSNVNIVEFILKLRDQRGGMVQTREQLQFIYEGLAYIYNLYFKKS
jgi:protein tyrosine phosphatase